MFAGRERRVARAGARCDVVLAAVQERLAPLRGRRLLLLLGVMASVMMTTTG